MNARILAAVGAFALTATAANIASAHLGMVPLGFGLAVSAGTFAAGAALVLRDAVHEAGGIRWAYVAVALGAVLSWATAGPALAIASTVAFAASEAFDGTIYAWVRRNGRALAVLTSGVAGSVLDTVLFLWLAPFPMTPGGVLGQTIVKVALSGIAAGVVAAHDRRGAVTA